MVAEEISSTESASCSSATTSPESVKAAEPKIKPTTPEIILPSPTKIIQSMGDGNYKLVTFALDLTGKRVDDEICQIAAFAQPKHTFMQYVMPFCDLSRMASRTHGLRISVIFGRYRVLRSGRTSKVLKTKSLYSTLNDFLDWLKEVKGSSDGILLAYHDHRNMDIPAYLIKGFEQYKMNEEFHKIVKGIINCSLLFKEHPPILKQSNNKKDIEDEVEKKKIVPLVSASGSLRLLIRQVLEMPQDKVEFLFGSARHRAEFNYQVLSRLLKVEDDVDIPFASIKEITSSN